MGPKASLKGSSRLRNQLCPQHLNPLPSAACCHPSCLACMAAPGSLQTQDLREPFITPGEPAAEPEQSFVPCVN